MILSCTSQLKAIVYTYQSPKYSYGAVHNSKSQPPRPLNGVKNALYPECTEIETNTENMFAVIALYTETCTEWLV